MKIETKYNIGNNIFFIQNNSVHQGMIDKIDVCIGSDGYNFEQHEFYDIRCCEKVIEKTYRDVSGNLIFPTKEELLASL